MNKQPIQRSWVGAVVLLLVMVWAISAPAQIPLAGGRPKLGDHSFTETVSVPSPFVVSFIRNRLGAGSALNLEPRVFEVGGEQIIGQRAI